MPEQVLLRFASGTLQPRIPNRETCFLLAALRLNMFYVEFGLAGLGSAGYG